MYSIGGILFSLNSNNVGLKRIISYLMWSKNDQSKRWVVYNYIWLRNNDLRFQYFTHRHTREFRYFEKYIWKVYDEFYTELTLQLISELFNENRPSIGTC